MKEMTEKRVNSSFVEAPAASVVRRDPPEWDPERRKTFFEEAGDLMRARGLAKPDELQSWMMGEPIDVDQQ